MNRNVSDILACAVVALGFVSTMCSRAEAGLVIGTFDSTRATDANLANGVLAEDMRASLASHFPGSSFSTAPSLTSSFLSKVNILAITSAKDGTLPITALSSSEQTALLSFVKAGGSAFLIAEGYSPYIPAAQSMVGPFGLTIADDGLTGVLHSTPTALTHPVIHGPFGDVTDIYDYGSGVFTNLGLYAHSLAKMDAKNLPVLAAIEKNALGPGSGRVVLMTDASPFADDADEGAFSLHETLFLNTIQYLATPEPSGLALAGIAGGVGALLTGVRTMRRSRRSRALARCESR